VKYDINLFEQLNEEYREKKIQTKFPQPDPEYQLKTAGARLAALAKLVPLAEKRVLEVGCGQGYVSSLLASEYNCSVVGVDIVRNSSWDLLKSKSPSLEYLVLDLSSNNIFEAGSFDLIVSFVAWEHIIHPFTMLKECSKILKSSGAIYIYANLYRAPNASHRYRHIFFPFPHLLFNDEIFAEYFLKHTGKSRTPSRLNKLTYCHYKEYFRILNLKIEFERLHKIPLDKDFYNRFKDKLELYPVFDLETAFFTVLLRKDSSGLNQKINFSGNAEQ
jgi:cyclopropane fatty-acyl-phospholipid synthase-like methyltransferase